MTTATRPWLRRLRAAADDRNGRAGTSGAEPTARRRVVCLPHAGSGTTPFRSLATALPPDLELWVACYPAREDRFTEPEPDSLAEVVHAVTAEVAALTPVLPTAIFGHSMGAVVAHEVAYELEQLGVRLELLVVSSSVAPQHPGGPLLADLPDEELLRHCRGLGDLPGQEAYDDPELSEILLRALRMDTRLVETHPMRPAARVRAPLLVLHGTRDDGCTPEQALDWAAVTEGPFSVRTIDGDHFAVLARPGILATELDARVPTAPAEYVADECVELPASVTHVLVGFSKWTVQDLGRLLPERSLAVLEEPQVIEARSVLTAVAELPCVAAVVPAPIQDEDHPGRCLRRVKASPAVTTVIPGTEYGVIAAASLAEHWGLPGAGVASVRILRHKDRLREHLQEGGFPQPRWALAVSPDQARAAHVAFGGRVVLKPTDRQGSVGVLLLDRDDDAAAAWVMARDAEEPGVRVRHQPAGLGEAVLVEERLDGPEVSVECLVRDGVPVFVNVTAKGLIPGRRPVERSHVVPAPLAASVHRRLEDLMGRFVRATGFSTGILHAECHSQQSGKVRQGSPRDASVRRIERRHGM